MSGPATPAELVARLRASAASTTCSPVAGPIPCPDAPPTGKIPRAGPVDQGSEAHLPHLAEQPMGRGRPVAPVRPGPFPSSAQGPEAWLRHPGDGCSASGGMPLPTAHKKTTPAGGLQLPNRQSWPIVPLSTGTRWARRNQDFILASCCFRRGLPPNYHRRCCVSQPSSRWIGVGPQRYGHQESLDPQVNPENCIGFCFTELEPVKPGPGGKATPEKKATRTSGGQALGLLVLLRFMHCCTST